MRGRERRGRIKRKVKAFTSTLCSELFTCSRYGFYKRRPGITSSFSVCRTSLKCYGVEIVCGQTPTWTDISELSVANHLEKGKCQIAHDTANREEFLLPQKLRYVFT